MDIRNGSPFYLRLSLNLVSIAILATAIYNGRSVLIPFFFSVLLATLLSPVIHFLHRRKFPQVLAILLSLFFSLLIIGVILYFLSRQIANFLNDIPTLTQRLNELLITLQEWIHQKMNITIHKQNQYISETLQGLETNMLVQRTVITLTEVISYVFFLPVYTFLILYHQKLIQQFLIDVFTRREEERVRQILSKAQKVSQQYVSGLLIELVIVFSLNSTGFLIFDIPYPFFLALVAAMLNIVPYIGMLIANIFSILVTLVSSQEVTDIFYVAGVLAGVQAIDNNITMPLIVGTRIKLNALVIITGVLVGNILAGVPGMFLAIPGLAMMKAIFEHIDELKPWALILGDELSREEHKPVFFQKLVKKWFGKKKIPEEEDT